MIESNDIGDVILFDDSQKDQTGNETKSIMTENSKHVVSRTFIRPTKYSFSGSMQVDGMVKLLLW